jgi:hypothetical protein
MVALEKENSQINNLISPFESEDEQSKKQILQRKEENKYHSTIH